MAFPTTIDSFTSPSSSDYLNSPAHATQHSNVNTAVNEIEKKMGTGASPATGATDGYVLTADGAGASAWEVIPVQVHTDNRAFGFAISGNVSVANDVSWDPTSPQALTAIKLWAYIKTAPTGANLIARVYNVTQAAIVATVTITAGSNSGNTASMTTASIVQGDVLRMDVTQIGSTVPGADLSLVLETTQP